jgi:hypothetical protein
MAVAWNQYVAFYLMETTNEPLEQAMLSFVGSSQVLDNQCDISRDGSGRISRHWTASDVRRNGVFCAFRSCSSLYLKCVGPVFWLTPPSRSLGMWESQQMAARQGADKCSQLHNLVPSSTFRLHPFIKENTWRTLGGKATGAWSWALTSIYCCG